MTTLRKPAAPDPVPQHPARPNPARPKIAELHAKIAKRFPKVIAALAK